MKKNFKLILALVLAAMMIASMIPAMAETYSITISDQNNVTVGGQKFTAYKLFDVTYTGSGEDDPHSYTLSTSSPFYSTELTGTPTAGSLAELLTTYFEFTAIPGDSSKVQVKAKSAFAGDGVRTFANALQGKLSGLTIPDAYKVEKTAGASDTSVTLNPTSAGYYVVTGTAKPVNDYDATDNPIVTAAVALTTTDPSASIKVKADAPELSKKITSSDGNTGTTAADGKDGRLLDAAGQAAVAAVGKVVGFELDSNVPDMTGYTKYIYTMFDTMSDGLDYVADSMVLKIDNTPITITTIDTTADAQAQADAKAAAAAYIVWKTDRSFELTINKTTLDQYDAGNAIVLTYNAKVNDSALTTDYEKNTAHLEYSRNPYDDSEKGKTPDDNVYVIDINLDTYKYVTEGTPTFKAKSTYADDAAAMAADYIKNPNSTGDDDYWMHVAPKGGAQFQLFKGSTQPTDTTAAWYHYDTTDKEVKWVVRASADTFETDTNGKFKTQVRGLAEGTYGLVETKAPDGYNPLSAATIVTITASKNGTTASYTANAGVITGNTIDLSAAQTTVQPLDTLQILNQKGTELPSTGGIGTTIFYIGGSILVLAAAILLITKRRMSSND